MPCEADVHTALVRPLVVMERPDDGQLLGVLRQQRQVLAILDARRSRGNRLELSPNIGGSIRLRVKRLVVAHAAPGIDHDAGLGLRRAGNGL